MHTLPHFVHDLTRASFSSRSDIYEKFYRSATPEQIDRYEHWRRSKIPTDAMRQMMHDILGSSTERGAIVLSGVAKMFVGDLIESARERMTAAGESGPIQPSHIRSAHRQAQRAGGAPPNTLYSTYLGTRHAGGRLFWR